jgi:tryptophan synthase alpha chain
MADGPAVQKGAVRALAAGMTTRGVLALARRFRDGDSATPLVLMGYYNPLLAFGLEAFAKAAAAAGVDGLIMVDLPPEEGAALQAALAANDIALIRLAAPTIDDGRLKAIAAGASGFVYLIAVTGVTGGKEADPAAAAPLVERVRAACALPVVVGFGIRTPERAAEVARIADAAVVGSALVDEITNAIALKRDPIPKVLARVAAMAQAVHEARI